MINRKLLLIVLFIALKGDFNAQIVSTDIDLIKNHIYSESNRDSLAHIKKKVVYPNSNGNYFKATIFIPLFIYQKIFSEQISARCQYEPTCSNFAVKSISELGIVEGIFLTADRLTRCNGVGQLETVDCLINHKTNKIIDVPKMYKFHN